MKLLKLLIVFCCLLVLAGCAWLQSNKTQIGQTSAVVLRNVAEDSFKIALSAAAHEATTGFTADWGNSLAQGAYQDLPSIASSDRFNEIASIWNPASPGVNAQLTAVIQKAASAASATGQQDPAAVKQIVTAAAVAAQAAVNGQSKADAVQAAVQAAQTVPTNAAPVKSARLSRRSAPVVRRRDYPAEQVLYAGDGRRVVPFASNPANVVLRFDRP